MRSHAHRLTRRSLLAAPLLMSACARSPSAPRHEPVALALAGLAAPPSACGGQVHFTVYPGVGHDAWNPAYDEPALPPWLMARRRA